MPLTVGIDGGYVDSCDLLDWFHVSMRLMMMNQIRRMVSRIQCAVRGSNASGIAPPLFSVSLKTHSIRKAQIGSTEAARRAGMIAATRVTLPSRPAVIISVVGSNGETPCNMP